MSGDWDDFDQTLLRAGKRHAAPAQLRERALAAVATGGVASIGALAAKASVVTTGKAATAAAIGKSVGVVSRLLALKWAFWATTATVGLASAAVYAGHRTSAPEPTAVLVAPPAIPIAPNATLPKQPIGETKAIPEVDVSAEEEASAAIVPTPSAAEIAAPTTAIAPREVESPKAASGHTAEPSRHASASTPVPAPEGVVAAGNDAPATATGRAEPAATGLAEEVRVLDEARTALRHGDSARALALCSEHSARFGHGSFGIEREVVRVDALVAAGRTDEAQERARSFVAAHPNAPQTARLRQLTSR